MLAKNSVILLLVAEENMEKKSLGAPIYYFTKLDYTVYRDPMDSTLETMPDMEVEAHYSCINLKNGKEKKGIAYQCVPYYPTSIPAVDDSINVIQGENGEYAIDPEVSYLESVNALSELVKAGTPMRDITVQDIKTKVQEYAQAIKS